MPIKSILSYDYGSYKGFFAENIVAQEFICSGINDIYSWKEGRSEVEFIREIEGEIIPVEVKSGFVTKSQSLKKFSHKYKTKYRTIMSANHFHIDLKNQVHRYPIYLAYRFPLLFK